MKKIVLALIALTLISTIPDVIAQQFSLETLADQSLEITLGENGEVHVMHEVKKSNDVKQVPLLSRNYSNLVIIDEEGTEPQHALFGAENVVITIFPHQDDIIIEYDLGDVLSLNDGIWTWDFVYLATTTFVFPENVDLVFANDRPVKMDDLRGMRCHGCDVMLEYIIDEPISIKEIQWEDKKFEVGIRTVTEITSFNFDQPNRSISFDVEEENQFITLFIPLELLWNPYDVYLDDRNILKHEFFNNGTHVWLNIRPDSPGTVLIIGTSAIPEFPILIPLFLGITAVILLHQRTKISLR